MCSSILIDYETGAFFDWNNWTVHFDLAHSRCSDHSCRAVSRVGSAHSGIAMGNSHWAGTGDFQLMTVVLCLFGIWLILWIGVFRHELAF